jgi:hypothetical protein
MKVERVNPSELVGKIVDSILIHTRLGAVMIEVEGRSYIFGNAGHRGNPDKAYELNDIHGDILLFTSREFGKEIDKVSISSKLYKDSIYYCLSLECDEGGYLKFFIACLPGYEAEFVEVIE